MSAPTVSSPGRDGTTPVDPVGNVVRPVDPHRPAEPDQGLGQRLRRFAGVREDILDWVPEERARYTRLGAIVLNAGVIAALSMLTALGKFLNVWWVFLLPLALLWGWVIVCIDSWLIASTHGISGAGRVFGVRLLLSILLGCVIAEPLVLKIFEPAIHRQVAVDRQQARAARETALQQCNPVPFRQLDRRALERCRTNGLLVSTSNSPASVQSELRLLEAERNAKQRVLNSDKRTLAEMERTARRECNGKKGDGFSGIPGEGPNCDRDREQVDLFRNDHNIAQREGALSALQTKINNKHDELGRSGREYAAEVNRKINAKLPPLAGRIGILEEHKALGRLSDSSFLVFAAQWLLRLLLILIDCLPVLTKKMSGTTTYDQMVARQLVTDDNVHAFDTELRMKRDMAPKRAELANLEYAERYWDQTRVAQDEAERLQQEAELDRKIDALAAKLRGE